MRWRRGTGIEPAQIVATRSTLDLKSRPGTSRGNLAGAEASKPIALCRSIPARVGVDFTRSHITNDVRN